ncbi:glycosyltransferase family 2 protein [Mailhella sp.]|uniref:glycosyltransferase family 2 protein n=1 Tax=Mailhella sp. TaxID=1981029 RepID=UPI00406350C2
MAIPAVSVVIPVYNSAHYLRQSLDSILAQTLQNIEIIIVDDGSNDGSSAILKEYAEKHERIILLAGAHEGAGEARNKGLARACGEYLAFVDSDDSFSPQMLEHAWQHAKRHDSDIVLFNYSITDESGIEEHRKGLVSGTFDKVTNLACGINCVDIANPEVWNKLFRRDFIIRQKIKFQNLKSCNDVFFVRAAFITAGSIHFLDEELLTWRKNPHSISTARHLNAENIIEAGKHLLKFTQERMPTTVIAPVYSMIFKHIMYEYEQFPSYADAKTFVSKVNAFLPFFYRWKFFKKRLRKSVKQFKQKFNI